MSSCYTRKLKDGEYLLDKNKIITNNDKIDKDELKSVIKQRPNRKIFSVVKFHLMLHNTMDSAKVAKREVKKIARKNKKIKRKNVRKIRKEKDTLAYKTPENFETFGEKVLYSIGEPPVVLDETASEKTANQLHIYLIRKGFFNNTVRDSVKYIDRWFKRKRAETFYIIEASNPYKINSVEIVSEDIKLTEKINLVSSKSLLKTNAIFDVDIMDDERERIATYLVNNGYYGFNKNYIKYYVDSSVGKEQVSIKLSIDLYRKKLINSDSIISTIHKQYHVSRINFSYIQDKTSSEESQYSYQGVDFIVRGRNNINSSLFYSCLFMKPGDLYSKRKQQQTFRKLSSLGVFKTVNIITELDSVQNQLVMNIKLEGDKIKDVKFEWNGTTSGSNFGLEGTVEYNMKNVFRGAETLHFGLSGALESQPLIVNDNTNDNTNIPIESFSKISSAFNTIEFGPEVSLTLPTLLFFDSKKYPNISNTKTVFTASLNYQRRLNKEKLDFERGIQEVGFGYSWNVKNKFVHRFDPISLSAVEVNKSQEFNDRINSLNDKLLAASFQNHIISSTHYRFVYNDLEKAAKSRSRLYYDASIESSGNILNTFYKVTGKTKDPVTNSFEMIGIPFSQYLKTQQDLRLYYKVNDKSSFVVRFVGGVGVPLENSRAALPFEKSFFAGGTDKTRAWKARSIGPGSFRDSILIFDKIGEILLEGNMEYRFDLLGFLDGALFVDAGNIWLMKEDSLRPGSNFKSSTFAGQIAIGAGFGIRVDLDFFLIRLDVAYPLKNPSLIEGERWFFQPKDEYNNYLNTLSNPSSAPKLYTPQFNIGIGYPF